MQTIKMRAALCSARVAVLLTALAIAPNAFAHVGLETGKAAVGSYYKAVFTVPHGCDGSPTTGIRIDVPEGIVAVKPMPKPGWELETTKGPYRQSFGFHGKRVAEGVRQVIWKGGTLPDDEYDEFVFKAYIASELTPRTTLYFPVIQTCEKGEERWTEIPKPGTDEEDLQSPAPSLKLLPTGAKSDE